MRKSIKLAVIATFIALGTTAPAQAGPMDYMCTSATNWLWWCQKK